MNKKGIWLLGIVVYIALITVAAIYIKMVSNYEPEVELVFTKVKIPEKTIITQDMLRTKKVRVSEAHRLSIRQLGDVAGKKAIIDIEEGEMLLSTKIADPNLMEDIQLKNKNNRLFTVEFKPDQANGWWLKTDQLVDIIFVPNPIQSVRVPSTSSQDALISAGYDKGSLTRLSNIRIAALIDDNGTLLDNNKRASQPKYISFEVTAEQDMFLAWAKSNGRIELASISGE